MALSGKMEVDVEIKTSADKFHDVMGGRPHHMTIASPQNIQTCDLHEGEFGKKGSVLYWNYVHDGKAKVAKEVVEDIDDVNMSTTFKVIEGDLLKEYKSFKFVVQATPKGKGSIVHWTLVYEKLNANIPEPTSMLEFAVDVTKDIDAHLAQA
ncbi:MLP-like protein 28 [Ricinus communis]|uniref:Major latex protein, putative n=2 Tax=Ricinus communis TaxID=3988 RepID=B9TAZ3_RICCO|nr:MLP-like protein 28 [Ricinus communis]EEF26971.1 Major latex protein, putative [Ricinus communis]|eukprot:XP_002535412.1 MLP-like protein 28 [Ricinus communis]